MMIVLDRKIELLPTFVNLTNKNTSKEKLGYMKDLTLFCNYNQLYLTVLSNLEKEVMPLVLMDDAEELGSKKRNKRKNIVDWMEKACV